MHKSNISLLIILIIALSLLTACFVKKRDFYVYKYPVVYNLQTMPLRTDGFYAPAFEKERVLFLYDNGVVKKGPWVRDFFLNKEKAIEVINTDYYTQKGKEYFGSFKIYDSSIIIQAFNIHSQHYPIYRRWVFESKGVILSDTSFLLHTKIDQLDKYEFYEVPVLFLFYPYENKPDSSNSWFNSKGWYRNQLHESRK
jgi:hypothetical protein